MRDNYLAAMAWRGYRREAFEIREDLSRLTSRLETQSAPEVDPTGQKAQPCNRTNNSNLISTVLDFLGARLAGEPVPLNIDLKAWGISEGSREAFGSHQFGSGQYVLATDRGCLAPTSLRIQGLWATSAAFSSSAAYFYRSGFTLRAGRVYALAYRYLLDVSEGATGSLVLAATGDLEGGPGRAAVALGRSLAIPPFTLPDSQGRWRVAVVTWRQNASKPVWPLWRLQGVGRFSFEAPTLMEVVALKRVPDRVPFIRVVG
jgi:hypothetical protein